MNLTRSVVSSILLMGASCGHAETVTWTGSAGSTSWSDAANWVPARVPGAQDDVVIPQGFASTVVNGPFSVASVLSSSPIRIDAPLTLSASSRFTSSVIINADISGDADLEFDADVEWRSGTIGGGGLGLFPATASITLQGAGVRRLARVIEVFGMLHIQGQTLLLDRPEALVRVSESATLWLENGAAIESDDTADPGFVVYGLLRSSGPGACTINSNFFSFGTVRIENTLNVTPAPGNIDRATRVLQGGTWDIAGGSITWPTDFAARAIAPETTVRLSGAASALVLHNELERVEGALEAEGALQSIAISSGVTPCVVTGRVRVTEDSRVAFNSGVVFADSAQVEIEPSDEQPAISAISAVTTAVQLGGVLTILPPRQTPQTCGTQRAILTAFGTVDPVSGSFATVASPALTPTQPYVYVALPLVGDVIEGVIVENRSSADWNGDEGIDADDVIAFFGDWDVSEADITGDGGTDGDDIIVFFERWDRGC